MVVHDVDSGAELHQLIPTTLFTSSPPLPPPPTMSTAQSVTVFFKDGTTNEEIERAAQELQSKGTKITQRSQSSWLGFAAVVPPDVLNVLNDYPQVDYVESDGMIFEAPF